jgi:hypothetical protein
MDLTFLGELHKGRIQMSVSIAGILTALGIKFAGRLKRPLQIITSLGPYSSVLPALESQSLDLQERLLRVNYATFTTLKIRFSTK